MNEAVQQAIEEIRSAFPGSPIDVEADNQGGAFVKARDLYIGGQYGPSRSWIAFRITFQYPHADVYPHYCESGVKWKDRNGLPEGFNPNNTWQTGTRSEPATMISRRSNGLNPSTDTAALKLQKVLDWMRSQ